MSDENRLTVKDDMVVTMAYRLTVDDEIIEDSDAENGERIKFIQGAGQILPALGNSLYGMKVGDSKEVTLQPEDGYGMFDSEAFADVPRSEFPTELPLKAGVELQMKDQDGDLHYAVVESVSSDSVHLNFNHPLAGKVLNFHIHITELRQATQSELEHGHVHDAHDEH